MGVQEKYAEKGLICLSADTALAGSRNLTHRREQRNLGRMQAALLGCPGLFYSHVHTASPARFLHEHASDPELPAISFRKLHIYLTFAFVSTGKEPRAGIQSKRVSSQILFQQPA